MPYIGRLGPFLFLLYKSINTIYVHKQLAFILSDTLPLCVTFGGRYVIVARCCLRAVPWSVVLICNAIH